MRDGSWKCHTVASSRASLSAILVLSTMNAASNLYCISTRGVGIVGQMPDLARAAMAPVKSGDVPLPVPVENTPPSTAGHVSPAVQASAAQPEPNPRIRSVGRRIGAATATGWMADSSRSAAMRGGPLNASHPGRAIGDGGQAATGDPSDDSTLRPIPGGWTEAWRGTSTAIERGIEQRRIMPYQGCGAPVVTNREGSSRWPSGGRMGSR